MIRRFHEAKTAGAPSVTLWGTGSPRGASSCTSTTWREACLFLLENYDDAEHVNVGVGEDVTIRELAETVAGIVGYEGEPRVGHLQA